jgi:hypothetical protein
LSRAARKRARPVLRGPRRGNAPGLPDEVYFSVIQRKLLTPDDFEDLDELATQILAFDKHYNAAARPFDWKFTRTDLNRLLARIRQHDRHAPHPLAA